MLTPLLLTDKKPSSLKPKEEETN